MIDATIQNVSKWQCCTILNEFVFQLLKDLSKMNILGIPINRIPAGNGNTLYDVAEILLNDVVARDLNNYIQVCTKNLKIILLS